MAQKPEELSTLGLYPKASNPKPLPQPPQPPQPRTASPLGVSELDLLVEAGVLVQRNREALEDQHAKS